LYFNRRLIESYFISSVGLLTYSERRGVCEGMELKWSDFRFLSGRKWVTWLRYTNFTSAFYRLATATYCSDITFAESSNRRHDVANSRWITQEIRSRCTCTIFRQTMTLNVKCRLIDESWQFLRMQLTVFSIKV